MDLGDNALIPPRQDSRTLSVPQAFALARQQHAAGALDDARRLYNQILNVVPDHVEILTMLASIAYRQSQPERAETYARRGIDLLRRAVQHQPSNAAARAALVNLLLAREQCGEAEALIRDLDIPLNPIRASAEEFAARRTAGTKRGLPTLLLATLPKSASESIWNKLAEGLNLAQCHFSLGLFPECTLVPARVHAAATGGLIVKEHIGATPHNLETLARDGLTRVIVHHRDPRQATLSWAHFARDDINQRLMAPLWRKIVPPADILARDLSAILDWCLEYYLPLLIQFLRAWRAVEADPKQPISVLFSSFEQFRTDPDGYFDRVLSFYDIEKKNYADAAEAEVVHLRKGRVDEWRSVFTAAQQRRAWERIPADMAADFGWEP